MAPLRKPSRAPAARRIIVASDRDLSRRALVALFAERGFKTVGQATTFPELVTLCRQRPHDLVVLNTRLPGTNGDSPVRGLLAQCPREVVVAICRHSNQHCAEGADRPGGEGARRLPCCPWADCLGRVLLDGARAVFRGGDSTGDVIRTMCSLVQDRAPATRIPSGALVCPAARGNATRARSLTSREREVAHCIGRGCANKEIASILDVSLATVKKHVGNILRKLSLQDRLQLALLVAHHPHFLTPSALPVRSPRR